MKVLQLNAWAGNLTPEIVRMLDREDPDIVCLQEVISVDRTAKILQSLEELLEAHTFKYVYYSPLVQFRYMHGHAQRGNAVLSKYPILQQDTFWTNGGAFQPDFEYSMGWNSARGVAHCLIDAPDGPIHVVTNHGYHVREHKNGTAETLAACQQIADYCQQLEGKVVLTGDFNLVPRSDSLEVLNRTMRNLCIEHDVQTTRNHLTTKTEVCDYIFVNDAVTVEDFAVLDDVVSDHKALVAIIK
mgnify:CR=1 FL=1